MPSRLSTLPAVLLSLFTLVGVSNLAHADAFDGSENLICSAIDTVQCTGIDSCVHGRALDVNMPQFFRLDFKDMIIRRKFVEGTERTSKIASMSNEGGALILQGVEEELGWTLLVEGRGRMTITASAADGAFVVFGACTAD